jgi:GxxExxY protein
MGVGKGNMSTLSVTAPKSPASKARLPVYAEQSLTSEIIAAAIAVHRVLGPGLVESAYQACLCRELELRNVAFVQQVDLPLVYKGIKLDCGYRIDLIVGERIIVELKAVQDLHQYMRRNS